VTVAQKILVAVAWPYANGSIHVGHVAGTYLPADIFARYHRLRGNDVLMVSGSDAHGTPVTLEAEKRGVSPKEIVSFYLNEFKDNWERLGISFDLFTSTNTEIHAEVSQEIFLNLKKNDYIYEKPMFQPFCLDDNRFLADRYVEGKCPFCSYEKARGDQCDDCGRTLDPQDLINMTCGLCGGSPEIRETIHFFFKLTKFEDLLKEWISKKSHWKPNVLNFTKGFLEGGLVDRPITRDIEWGVEVPLDGYESKRLYVWFEAVIGYLSASKEWAIRKGEPDAWKDFWTGESRSYYFMGKDNIIFHSILWPAMLMGNKHLNLPFDVPANEFLNMEGFKLSTSRNWAVWIPDYLDRYEPDPLRYVIASNLPESSDSDFSWAEYLRANNDELVATYGNLIHRVLSMTYNYFDGHIPSYGSIDPECEDLLEKSDKTLLIVGESIEKTQFRKALAAAMGLASEANKFLEVRKPWQIIKTDKTHAASTLWTALSVINCLRVVMEPFMPFSSIKLKKMLGISDEQGTNWIWDRNQLIPGVDIPKPVPLFKKLDELIIEEEDTRLKI